MWIYNNSNNHLVKTRRDQVALTDGVDEAQQLGRVGTTYDPGMFPGVPVQHLASHLLACLEGGLHAVVIGDQELDERAVRPGLAPEDRGQLESISVFWEEGVGLADAAPLPPPDERLAALERGLERGDAMTDASANAASETETRGNNLQHS